MEQQNIHINNQRTSRQCKFTKCKSRRKNSRSCTSKPIRSTSKQNATSFELYVIPEDPKAKVQIDNNIEVTGTASATIPKNTDKAEVKIKVTAQDGTTEEYTLIVTNQSDDCKLAILKVDGEILEPDEQGKYHVTKKILNRICRSRSNSK